MTIRVAISGYGRIGRNVLRAYYEYKQHPEIEIVAVNSTMSPEATVHLTRYDTTHGRFDADINLEDEHLIINGDRIRLVCNRDPSQLPWAELGVDVVHECTGAFTTKETASAHLAAGAKKVIISAPGKGVDATVVYGVNHEKIKPSDTVISCASCTTNCLAPVAKALHERLGIVNGLMTTIHAYTNDQVLLDSNHKDLRRARSATQSLIPTKTGAAAAVGQVLPELSGKLDGYAIRVPTINVSMVDLTFQAQLNTTVDEVNQIMQQAADNELKSVMTYCNEPLVSIDFNHDPASAIFDATQTRVIDNTVKVGAWYDNEWGFSNRMLDLSKALMEAGD